MTPKQTAKLTPEQEERFDEARLYLYHPDGSRLSEKAVKQHLADELQRQRERVIKLADDLWMSPPWSPEWSAENYKVEGYRRAIRDIQEALQDEEKGK